ncbi:MAG TPA: TetR/AcrR family transcriptional regulator [Methylophilaceae bacterium]|jgi:AcrR family transcriptional regulator
MSAASLPKPDSHGGGSRPTKGQSSRAAILFAAAKLATTKGLSGLSIGDLAAEVGMSKSGLYAHFKSKEDLELAIVETAAVIFNTEVIEPAMDAHKGLVRLRALIDSFLSYLERRLFPGGCFFAAVALELDTRPGPARDRVVQVLDRWLALLTECVVDAQALGEIDEEVDVTQAVFEIEAMLLAANFLFVMTSDPAQLKQSRAGVENVLLRLVTNAAPKKKAAARSVS